MPRMCAHAHPIDRVSHHFPSPPNILSRLAIQIVRKVGKCLERRWAPSPHRRLCVAERWAASSQHDTETLERRGGGQTERRYAREQTQRLTARREEQALGGAGGWVGCSTSG